MSALLTYEQLSEKLGMAKTALYKMVERQQIPHFRLGQRTVRFDEDKIDAWLEECSCPNKRRSAEPSLGT